MKKSLVYTYGLLIALTLVTAVVSNTYAVTKFLVVMIIGLSMIKFLIVAFQFMDLKKANPFWKWSLSLLLFLLCFFIAFF